MLKPLSIFLFLFNSSLFAMELTPNQQKKEPEFPSLVELCLKKIPNTIQLFIEQENPGLISPNDEKLNKKVKELLHGIPPEQLSKIVKQLNNNPKPEKLIQHLLLQVDQENKFFVFYSNEKGPIGSIIIRDENGKIAYCRKLEIGYDVQAFFSKDKKYLTVTSISAINVLKLDDPFFKKHSNSIALHNLILNTTL